MADTSLIPLDAILDRQKQAWIDGKRPALEEAIQNTSLLNNTEVILDLIYNEIVVREEIGETPSLDEYVARYPHLRDDLKLHFEVHSALKGDAVSKTRRLEGDASGDASLFSDTSTSIETGPLLAEYELIAELGRGGMGVVYKAKQRRLNRLVALKMFQPGRFPSRRELLRFQTEAKAIARLQHPNIVQIFEVGKTEKLPFLVLELADQETLAQKLRNKIQPPREAAALVETLARAVQHAHDNHIVHRDLKPANVLFAKDGSPKIADFGLAKLIEDDPEGLRDATRTGEPVGTPRYMAPEQAAGRPDEIGPCTDIYSLGTILYECLTGQTPFMSANVVETMEKIRRDPPTPPRRSQPTIPRDLETICLKCLRKEPGHRYGRAADLADDLGRFQRGEPILARPTPQWERLWMWSRRRPTQAALAAVVVVLLVVAAGGFGIREYRVAGLRNFVEFRIAEGKLAMNDDPRAAKSIFGNLLDTIKAEPALHPYETGVSGWLKECEKRTVPGRDGPAATLDELRDEAFVRFAMVEKPNPRAVADLREVVRRALALTGDRRSVVDRNHLALLDADLLLHEGKATEALAKLDAVKDACVSRWWHNLRADCFDALDRRNDADQERREAEQFVPTFAGAWFLNGVDRLKRNDPAAVADFDAVLRVNPGNILAEILRAQSLLKSSKWREAEVGLTAAIAKDSRFAWTYVLRGQVRRRLGDFANALEDARLGLGVAADDDAVLSLSTLRILCRLETQSWDDAEASFRLASKSMSGDERRAYWRDIISTGLDAVRESAGFRRLDRMFQAPKEDVK